jgi:putative phage-type endonuclease
MLQVRPGSGRIGTHLQNAGKGAGINDEAGREVGRGGGMSIATDGTDRQSWLEQRRAGIGGSDVAAMLGLSKWKTPYQLYLDKRGELPEQEDNEAMFWGRGLEPVIRRRYELETGLTVHMHEGILQHPEYSFMLANLDGQISDELILEIKTARYADGWGEVNTAEIPIAYSLQCQWYLMITGALVADVAVLISGSDFRLYQIEADEELQIMLTAAAIEFWQRVQDGNPPDVITYGDAVERYGKSDGSSSILTTEEVFEAYQELAEIRKDLKHYEAKEEEQKAIICKYMGDQFDTIIDATGKPLVTWKLAKGRTGFNSKQLQLDHPELAKQYTTTGESSRKLLIK